MEFPSKAHKRRHRPVSKKYGAYKQWVRDEFQFRCVYCLERDRWSKDTFRIYHIDHVKTQKLHPKLTQDYRNLAYSCANCNSKQNYTKLPDPCKHAIGKYYRFDENGLARPTHRYGARYIRIIGLNLPHLVDWRRRKFQAYKKLQALADIFVDHDDLKTVNEALQEIIDELGYPIDMPDLRLPEHSLPNKRRNSQDKCYFARLEKGEILPYYG